MQTIRRGGAYVDAGAIRTYYERTGTGDPLVLLHGDFCTAETLDGLAARLAETYTVYVPERRGHGRTPDVDGPITYENMAADTIAFLDAIHVAGAHLVGYSGGAVVALLAALERPDLVDRLVLIGQPMNHAGAPAFVRDMLPGFSQEMLPSFLKDLYAATSPDGAEHFDVVFEKLRDELTREPSMRVEQLTALAAPTLVLLGDRDMITPEHAIELVRAIPVAQLGIVDPGWPLRDVAGPARQRVGHGVVCRQRRRAEVADTQMRTAFDARLIGRQVGEPPDVIAGDGKHPVQGARNVARHGIEPHHHWSIQPHLACSCLLRLVHFGHARKKVGRPSDA